MTEQGTVSAQRKLTTFEQVVCAVPLVLIFVGGAIGGAAGGLAWAINQKIMRGNAPAPMRYGLTVLTFVGAVGLYFAAIFILTMLFPNLVARPGG